jgi:hypothetical protein
MKRKLSVILLAVLVPLALYLCLMLAVDVASVIKEGIEITAH